MYTVRTSTYMYVDMFMNFETVVRLSIFFLYTKKALMEYGLHSIVQCFFLLDGLDMGLDNELLIT